MTDGGEEITEGARASGDRPATPSRRRLLLLGAAAILAVIIGAVVVVVLKGQSDPDGGSSAEKVPGIAAIEVKPGSPPICAALAQPGQLREFDTAVAQLAVPETAKDGAAKLTAIAESLRQASSTVDEPLKTRLGSVAGALQELGTKGLADAAAVNAASTQLGALGAEVQSTCQFPVG